jgi:uncharacterized protein YdhG (YjbR/CyaY superfamily)
MAKNNFESVDAYIAAQPEAAREALARVRDTLRASLPGAEEAISYQIPTYKLQGKPVLYFAGWKRHFSLYPATELVLTTFEQELSMYVVQKGTIRFPLTQTVPVKLIARIAKLRAKETLSQPSRKKGAEKKRPVKKR